MGAKYRYPGTKPFSYDERTLFFGRDEDIANLRTSVVVNPTTVLFGRSGTGKSSLIQAGLIPGLQRTDHGEESGHDEEQQEAYPPYVTLTVIPKPYNNEMGLWPAISRIISSLLENEGRLFPDQPVTIQTNSLWYQLKRFQYQQASANRRQVLLLILDQAEELFTYPDSQIGELVRQLAPVINQYVPEEFKGLIQAVKRMGPSSLLTRVLYDPIPVKFIFSIRSDKLHLITRLKKASPLILQNSYELLPLSRQEAFDAISKPSQLEGDFLVGKFTIDDQTKESIFRQLSEQTAGPDYNTSEERIDPFSLQIVCSHIEQKIAPFDTDKIIQPAELPDIKAIINGYYLDCIKALPITEEQRDNVRNLIELRLISNNRRIPIHEDLITGDDKYPVSKDILAMLVEAKILKTDSSMAGGWMYEITHDSFIRPILEARMQRLEINAEDPSKTTINDLLKKIREKEGMRNQKDLSGSEGSGIGRFGIGFINIGSGSMATNIVSGNVGNTGSINIGNTGGNVANTGNSGSNTSSSTGSASNNSRQSAARIPTNEDRPSDSSSSSPQTVSSMTSTSNAAISGGAIEDFELYDLYKKLGDAYVITREFDSAITQYNKIIQSADQTFQYNSAFLVEAYRGRSAAYYSLNRYDLAISDLKKILAINRDDHTAFNYLIDYYDKQDQLNEAIAYVEKEATITEGNAGLYTEIGNKFLARKDYDKAIAFYRKTLALKPEDMNAFRNQGIAEETRGNLEAAMEFYQKALEISLRTNDKPATNYNDVGNIYFAQKDYENARKEYLNAVNQDPQFFYAWYNLGYLAEMQEDNDKAIENYKKALECNSSYEDALLGLVRVYMVKGDYQQTKDIILQLNQNEPSLALAYFRLGYIDERFQKWESAINNYKEVIKLDGNFVDALNNLSEIYLNLAKFEEAKELCQKLIILEPSQEQTYRNRLGRICFGQGKLQEAITEYQRALELEPEVSANYYNIGLAYKKLDAEKSIPYFNKTLELDPADVDSLNNLGVVYQSLGKNEEAAAAFKKAIEAAPKESTGYANLGSILIDQEKYEQALEQFTMAIELDPAKAQYFSDRGYIYRQLDRYEEAAKDLARCVEIEPLNGTYCNRLGYAYLMQWKFDEATETLKNAISHQPDNESSYLGLASANLMQHQYEEVMKQAGEVLKLDNKSISAHAVMAAAYREQGNAEAAKEQTQLVHALIDDPDNQKCPVYNKACAEALCVCKDNALSYLGQALSSGEVTAAYARRDVDFYAIRDTPEFIALTKG